MLPLALPLVLLTLAAAQPPGGLTFETCRSDLGCTPPRTCRDETTFRACDASARTTCLCVPPAFTPCRNSTQCTDGEVCARTLNIPFVCTSALVAVPPNGPTTAEDALRRPFVPVCPRANPRPTTASKSASAVPPDAPPDAPPAPPPATPPDARPNDPPLQPRPLPGPPPPPEVTDPKRNGLNLQICKAGTCARDLSCVSFDSAASFEPPDGARTPAQSFRCCETADPVCICHARDTRPVCGANGDCNRKELCVGTPVSPPTCTAQQALEKLTKGQRRLVTVFEGGKGEVGRGRPLVPRGGGKGRPDTLESSDPEEVVQSEEAEVDGGGEVDEATPAPEASAPPPSSSPTPEVGASDASTEPTGATETQEDDAICIDAAALAHLPRTELVFAQDRHARVLCDVAGSCATHGHIVRFREETMMMRSYCMLVPCVERVMKVNSPRYRRARSVKSRTDGLVFMALAARYATAVEERVLQAVVRVGF